MDLAKAKYTSYVGVNSCSAEDGCFCELFSALPAHMCFIWGLSVNFRKELQTSTWLLCLDRSAHLYWLLCRENAWGPAGLQVARRSWSQKNGRILSCNYRAFVTWLPRNSHQMPGLCLCPTAGQEMDFVLETTSRPWILEWCWEHMEGLWLSTAVLWISCLHK
jgi:hypothetical protein